MRIEVRRLLGLVTNPADAFSIPSRTNLPKYENTEPYKTFIVGNVWNILTEDLVVSSQSKICPCKC